METQARRVEDGHPALRDHDISESSGLGEDQTVVRIALDRLSSGPSPRAQQLSEHHLAVLLETSGRWPPILVRSGDRVIVDGHHRVAAARRLGLQTICAFLFEGSDDEVYVEAVRRNIDHGLPLSVSERVTAALEVLRCHPDWSDRRISTICGLAPGTVGNARLRLPGPKGHPVSSATRLVDKRVGTDGRWRPVDREALREHIAELVMADPSASLREIARLTGASPETVRGVRSRIRSRCVTETLGRPSEDEQEVITQPETPQAFVSTQSGRDFLDWFTKTRMEPEEGLYYALRIPLNRIYEVADEARRRANDWAEFANLVEKRALSGR